ncbi:MAG: ATP-binding protein [Acidobacteriota bacterium]
MLEKLYSANCADPASQGPRTEEFRRNVAESTVYPLATLRFLEQVSYLGDATYRTATSRKDEIVKRPPIAFIFEHAEMLFPEAPAQQLNDIERQRVVQARDWLGHVSDQRMEDVHVLVTGNRFMLSSYVASLPRMKPIELGRPTGDERKAFLKAALADRVPPYSDAEIAALSDSSAGLTLVTLDQLVRGTAGAGGRLGPSELRSQVATILESELGEYLELKRGARMLDAVIGNKRLKEELRRYIAILRSGDVDAAPTGFLVAGPNGTGKTFIFESFANELGWSVVVLKKIRSMWLGETDAIFERIRQLLEAVGNVVVFIDEADTQFGSPGNQQTHETEKRLWGKVVQMMSDGSNRGRILWLLLTARPWLLAPDLKRSGRCGIHLPVFDPVGAEREEFVGYVFKRAGIALDDAMRQAILASTDRFSAADFNEIAVYLKGWILGNAGKLPSAADLATLVADYRAPDLSAQRRLQTLHAALECTLNSLIPDETLRDRDKVEAEIQLLTASGLSY